MLITHTKVAGVQHDISLYRSQISVQITDLCTDHRPTVVDGFFCIACKSFHGRNRFKGSDLYVPCESSRYVYGVVMLSCVCRTGSAVYSDQLRPM